MLAYFGGDNGSGHDYAGKNIEDGKLTGGHPPGSSFKVYTLAAALDNNISLQSRWDATPDHQGTRPGAERRPATPAAVKFCTLRESTLQSYNVPFYYITKKLGPDKVVDMAKARRCDDDVEHDTRQAVDLTKVKGRRGRSQEPFYNVVGYGQYPITVLDHANGVATLANRGIYSKAHFVVTGRAEEPRSPASG